MKRAYEKRYWPFVLWLIALVAGLIVPAELAGRAGLSRRGMTAVGMTALLMMLTALFVMIWKGEYVYWISGGPDFEQAKAAGSERRRAYAGRHLRAMLLGGCAALAILAAEYCCGANELTMILSVGACVIAAAVSTTRIHWTEERNDMERRKEKET